MNSQVLRLALVAMLLAGCRPTEGEHAGHQGHAAPPSVDAHAGHDDMAMEESAPPTVRLDARQRALARVATERVTRKPFRTEITAAGRVTYDESRLSRITAWVDGRIQRFHGVTSGSVVKKGQPVLDLYSPDLESAQAELLLAAQSSKELSRTSIPGIREDAERLLAASRRRLRLWGISEAQIDRVLRTGRPLESMPIPAPQSGVVLRKTAQVGDWVDKGMVLLELADLSAVWVEADVYEYELANLRVGQSVSVESVAYPGSVFRGKIAFIQPVMAAETRTNSVRIELANPAGRLKPDMYVTATLASDQGSRLVVPKDAVVETGKRQVVWVQTEPNSFEAREVQVGSRSDDAVEIRSGLQEGEVIAVSGGFLIDATSQLKGSLPHQGH